MLNQCIITATWEKIPRCFTVPMEILSHHFDLAFKSSKKRRAGSKSSPSANLPRSAASISTKEQGSLSQELSTRINGQLMMVRIAAPSRLSATPLNSSRQTVEGSKKVISPMRKFRFNSSNLQEVIHAG